VASRSERRGYSASRLILVNYESVRSLVQALCGPGPDIRLVPYAAPAAFRVPDTRGGAVVPEAVARLQPSEGPLIVSVSRHDPRKGVDLLVRALAGLAAAGTAFRACLVGPGPLLAANRSLASRLGLSGRVTITGHVSDVFPFLSCADVFALPSLEEGSGSVSLLEALQAATAVVASACDGIPEDLVDGRDALLVPPGGVAALQQALGRLLGDAPLRATLAARARRVYEEKFSSAMLVSALTDVYADVGFVSGT
jgi:glycosyltransferase involved in cell wall biosynthesis